MGTPQQRKIPKVQRHTRFHCGSGGNFGYTSASCPMSPPQMLIESPVLRQVNASLFTLSCAYTGCFSGIPSLDLMTCGVHSARQEQYSRFRCIAQAGHHTRHLWFDSASARGMVIDTILADPVPGTLILTGFPRLGGSIFVILLRMVLHIMDAMQWMQLKPLVWAVHLVDSFLVPSQRWCWYHPTFRSCWSLRVGE